MENLFVIKIGGNVIDNENNLQRFLRDLASINQRKVLVHGGGKIATEISKGLGIEAQMVDGRRITDAETLKIVTMVYGGLVNKRIVSQLQAFGNNAIGLTGADANIIQARKREIKNGIDYGFVGDVENVNSDVLEKIISLNLTPIIAPLTHDKKGTILNTNADTVASALAVGLSKSYKVDLLYCFELDGVLEDINDKSSVISTISFSKYSELKEKGIIAKGMIPKMDNSFDAIRAGVNSVVICHSNDLTSIIDKKEKKGTVLSM